MERIHQDTMRLYDAEPSPFSSIYHRLTVASFIAASSFYHRQTIAFLENRKQTERTENRELRERVEAIDQCRVPGIHNKGPTYNYMPIIIVIRSEEREDDDGNNEDVSQHNPSPTISPTR